MRHRATNSIGIEPGSQSVAQPWHSWRFTEMVPTQGNDGTYINCLAGRENPVRSGPIQTHKRHTQIRKIGGGLIGTICKALMCAEMHQRLTEWGIRQVGIWKERVPRRGYLEKSSGLCQGTQWPEATLQGGSQLREWITGLQPPSFLWESLLGLDPGQRAKGRGWRIWKAKWGVWGHSFFVCITSGDWEERKTTMEATGLWAAFSSTGEIIPAMTPRNIEREALWKGMVFCRIIEASWATKIEVVGISVTPLWTLA